MPEDHKCSPPSSTCSKANVVELRIRNVGDLMVQGLSSVPLETTVRWIKTFSRSFPGATGEYLTTLPTILGEVLSVWSQDHDAFRIHCEWIPSALSSWLQAFCWFSKLAGATVGREAREDFLARYFLYALLDKGEDVLKFHTMFIFNTLTDQEMSPSPGLFVGDRPGIIFVPLYRRLGKVLSRKGRRASASQLRLGYSLLQAKKACEAVSPRKQQIALADHAKTLSQTLDDEAPIPDEELLLMSKIAQKIPRRRETYSVPWLTPSFSSHFGCVRSGGGAAGHIRTVAGVPIGWSPVLYRMCEDSCGVVRSVYCPPAWDWVEHYSACLPRLLSQKSEQFRFADIHLVLEPFKVRTISAGPPTLYSVGRIINRLIHGPLGHDPVYEYTHKTVDQDTMGDFLWGVPRDGWTIVSGDYKSATDYMRPKYTLAMAQLALRRLNLSPQWERKCLDSLVGHVLHYKDKSSVGQTHGQLMGSPLSFPVLCMVNEFVAMLACERAGYPYEQIRLRINGDDCLLAIPDFVYPFWVEAAKQVGFNLSIGKNYVSNNIAMINSRLYRINFGDDSSGNQRMISTTWCPYWNLGIASGRGRVLSDSRDDVSLSRQASIGACARKLLEGLPESEARPLMKLFLRQNAAELESRWGWFVPESLGGVGMPTFDPVVLSDLDAKRCTLAAIGDQRMLKKLAGRFPMGARPTYVGVGGCDSDRRWSVDGDQELIDLEDSSRARLAQYYSLALTPDWEEREDRPPLAAGPVNRLFNRSLCPVLSWDHISAFEGRTSVPLVRPIVLPPLELRLTEPEDLDDSDIRYHELLGSALTEVPFLVGYLGELLTPSYAEKEDDEQRELLPMDFPLRG